MGLDISTVADSIASLSVTGVDIKDLDEMKDEVYNRDCPLVMPAPNYITNLRPERDSLGSGSGTQWNVRYTLNYRFFHSRAGTERGLAGVYKDLTDKVVAFVDSIFANDNITGAIDIQNSQISIFGVVDGPSGNQFYGCDISLDVLEFIN